jgi:hypothetical protein
LPEGEIISMTSTSIFFLSFNPLLKKDAPMHETYAKCTTQDEVLLMKLTVTMDRGKASSVRT